MVQVETSLLCLHSSLPLRTPSTYPYSEQIFSALSASHTLRTLITIPAIMANTEHADLDCLFATYVTTKALVIVQYINYLYINRTSKADYCRFLKT